jgi:hypothetical protein
MRVIVYAQDLSGRKDDGHYTRPSLDSALDLFFGGDGGDVFGDEDGTRPLSRAEAVEIFATDNRVAFFNVDGEKVVISRDHAA